MVSCSGVESILKLFLSKSIVIDRKTIQSEVKNIVQRNYSSKKKVIFNTFQQNRQLTFAKLIGAGQKRSKNIKTYTN